MSIQKIFKYSPVQSTTMHISERIGINRKHIYSTNLYFIFTYFEDIKDWRLTYFINRFGKILRVKNMNDINNSLYNIAISIKWKYLRNNKSKEQWIHYIDNAKILEDE